MNTNNTGILSTLNRKAPSLIDSCSSARRDANYQISAPRKTPLHNQSKRLLKKVFVNNS